MKFILSRYLCRSGWEFSNILTPRPHDDLSGDVHFLNNFTALKQRITSYIVEVNC